MSFIIGFFGWLLYIAACILYNYVKIEKQKIKPVYFQSNLARIFFAIIFLVIMSADDGFSGIDFAYPKTLIPYIPNMIYMISSFYVFFDAGLNGLRKLEWNYKGEDSGWLDSMKLAFYYVLKAFCFIAMVWSTVMLWR